MTAWMPALLCACGNAKAPRLTDDAMVCEACGASRPITGGILQCVSDARQQRLDTFLAQYRTVRQRDGYRRQDANYYRALPDVAEDDPAAPVWRIRQRTFARLVEFIQSRPQRTSLAVLDLGAGSGWLCHRLSQLGHRAVAVDVLDDECDGLGAARHYDTAFVRLRADFNDLPIAPGQFDVVVFNGSLHYSPDISATIAGAARCLRHGGAIAVLDSPTFDRESDGELLRVRLIERLRTEGGVADPIVPGDAYVTLPKLAAVAATLGLAPRFTESSATQAPVWRQLAARLRRRAPSPRFGLWVAA